MEQATDRQQEALEFIYDHIVDKGFAPSLREIGKHMSILSTNGVNDHLLALERKGLIERTHMISRAIRITEKGGKLLNVELKYPGAMVLVGTAEITDVGDGHTLSLVVTNQAYNMLAKLVDTGLFGTTRADVAERLLYEKLREVLIQHRRSFG